jgi:hypothetical protein
MVLRDKKPITLRETTIVINLNEISKNVPIEDFSIIRFDDPIPKISVFCEDIKGIEYCIEPLSSNPNLEGQFLFISIRVLENFVVMIDGLISKDNKSPPSLNDENGEGIRFQPFFLPLANIKNENFYGRGLFERGLHFSGIITPGNVRLSCVCDICRKSFNLQSFHAGMSNGQYFYSTDSSRTLFVNSYEIGDMPGQLQKEIDLNELNNVESKLPKPDNGSGLFKYYNPLRCPYCKSAYIDFEKYPEIRPSEYYGNTYVNQNIQTLKK